MKKPVMTLDEIEAMVDAIPQDDKKQRMRDSVEIHYALKQYKKQGVEDVERFVDICKRLLDIGFGVKPIGDDT